MWKRPQFEHFHSHLSVPLSNKGSALCPLKYYFFDEIRGAYHCYIFPQNAEAVQLAQRGSSTSVIFFQAVIVMDWIILSSATFFQILNETCCRSRQPKVQYMKIPHNPDIDTLFNDQIEQATFLFHSWCFLLKRQRKHHCGTPLIGSERDPEARKWCIKTCGSNLFNHIAN